MNKKRLFAWLGIVLVLGSVAILGRPLYRSGKAWRARHLAAESADLLEKQKGADAFAKAQAAYRLAPNEPATIRAVARVLTARRDPSALAFWEQAAKTATSTKEDRRAYIEAALAAGVLPLAVEQVRALLDAGGADAGDLALAARVDAQRGDLPAAISHARRAHALDPASGEIALLLAALLVASADSAPEGRAMLWKLGEGQTQQAVEAFVLLARQKDLPPDEKDRLIAALWKHPLSTEAHRRLALELEMLRHPDQRQNLLATAIAAHRDADPALLREFGVWLNAIGEPGRVIEAIPIEKARTRKDLFLVHLDAMAALKDWKGIAAVIEKGDVPLEASLVEVFRARCAMELGDGIRAELHWRKARGAAGNDTNQIWFVANYAEKLGQLGQAAAIYQSLLDNPQVSRPATEALLRTALRKGTAATRDALGEIRSRWPQDRAVANDYAYMNLLLGDAIEPSRREAQQLVEKSPESLPHRTTLALAFLRLRDPAGALRVYSGLRIPWDKAPASSVAVYAAVLHANGRPDEARKLASALRPETLRPEEKNLIAFAQQ